MNKQQFIKILERKEFNEKTAQLLRPYLKKYPYFTPLVVAYLLSLKASDEIQFKTELVKFAPYLTNKRQLILKLLEIDKLVALGQLPKQQTDTQDLDKQIYEQSKRRHEQIVKEIIEPKIEKLRQLSELHKTQEKQQPAEKQPTEPQVAEAKPETKAPTVETTMPAADTEEVLEIEFEPPVKTSTEPETAETSAPTTTDQKETPTRTEPTSIDDIFKKIEELKKQKLKAVDGFRKRVDSVDKMLEEQKVREEITPSEKDSKEPQRPRKKTVKSVDAQVVEQAAKTEKTTETPTTAQQPKTEPETHQAKAQEKLPDTTDKTDKIPETKTQTEQKPKPEQEPVEQPEPKSEPKAEQPEQKPEPKPEPKAEQPEQKPEPKPESKAEKPEQKPEAKQEKTEPKPQAEPSEPKKETKTKSAADRILEEIARRREQRKKKQLELIDRFLQEQPSIDRTKQPTVEGDLSEPHTREIEVVTENMAKIYELQGLYDKALDIYQKLILQKPEKKDYFAQKIDQLKQKLNS